MKLKVRFGQMEVKLVSSLADHIEAYIKKQLQHSPNHILVLNRAQLASAFSCVPSQINYVLTTRFTQERGYVIESRRGGGGYIRVVKTMPGRPSDVTGLLRQIGTEIGDRQVDDILIALIDRNLLTQRQAQFIKGILQQELNPPPPGTDRLRASLLRAMLLIHLHEPKATD